MTEEQLNTQINIFKGYATINEFFKEYGVLIYHLFEYGSCVYGTSDEYSDRDYIAICKEENVLTNCEQLKFKDGDITFYSLSKFKELIEQQEISVLECLFQIDNNIFTIPNELISIRRDYICDKAALRKSISQKCSNSWVKAKKKMTIEKDFDLRIAKKSLFHSIRMYDFGIQIGSEGKINNFQSCANLWNEIKSYDNNDYKFYKEKYQPLYNECHSNFVKLCPKK